MKVLHINYSDYVGGAARAAHRLHVGLSKIGVDSRMLVVRKDTKDSTVIAPLPPSQLYIHRIRNRLERELCKLQSDENPIFHSLNLFSSGLSRYIQLENPDIVNLHWIGWNTLSIREIGQLKPPVVWTLHDMWPFSGTAHYDADVRPQRWRNSYTRRNRPKNLRGLDWDSLVFSKKKANWSPHLLHLVTPSRWLADCAKESSLFGQSPCTVIQNGIDLEVYQPCDRERARRELGLPLERPLILFGAISSTDDPRKGFELLRAALKMKEADLIERGCEIIVFGNESKIQASALGNLKIHYLGFLEADSQLALAYSAADVFVAPSLQDNFPNTMVEALACGTPCAAFAIGGFKDIVVSGRNGYLARPFLAEDLAAGILSLLDAKQDELRRECRGSAERSLGDTDVATMYKSYYEAVIAAHKAG